MKPTIDCFESQGHVVGGARILDRRREGEKKGDGTKDGKERRKNINNRVKKDLTCS